MEQNQRIDYISKGLAYTLSDGSIQVNSALLKRPDILGEILEHEMGHCVPENFIKDFFHDLRPFSLGVLFFCMSEPSTWWAISPIRYERGRVYYDVNSLFLAVLILGVVSFFVW